MHQRIVKNIVLQQLYSKNRNVSFTGISGILDIGSPEYVKEYFRDKNCKELSAYEREFTWNWSKLSLKIRDSFQFNKSGYEIKESFITKVEPLLAQPGIVLIETGKSITELEFNPKLRCIIEKCSFNNHSGSSAIVYRTTVILKNTSETADIGFNITVFPKVNK